MLALASMVLTGAAAGDQVFLEGFPDVPLLQGVEEHTGDRMVFDAPSGTVAETSIRAPYSSNKLLDAYAKELPAFGWACNRLPQGLRCTLEQNALVFLDQAPDEDEALIILRLEPVG